MPILYLCIMTVFPNSLMLLQEELIHHFDVGLAIKPLLALVYQLDIIDSEVTLIFYLSLHGDIVHTIGPSLDRKILHIDEDLFLTKPAIVLSRVAAALQKAKRIYARNTTLTRIDKNQAMSFQEENHLQAALPGKYRYGLFYQQELVSMAVFSGGRHMRDQPTTYRSFELLRFCHKTGVLVVGGLSKLIQGMMKQFRPDDVMTYVDRDWSDGTVYSRLGFDYSGMTPPQLFYIEPITRHRYDKKTYLTKGVLDKHDMSATACHKLSNLGSIKMRYRV